MMAIATQIPAPRRMTSEPSARLKVWSSAAVSAPIHVTGCPIRAWIADGQPRTASIEKASSMMLAPLIVLRVSVAAIRHIGEATPADKPVRSNTHPVQSRIGCARWYD
jgi:hypothetical protein